jgi:hypothetical protein
MIQPVFLCGGGGGLNHVQHIPRLLHDVGFSVRRPRRRLARADKEAQAVWINERLPAIKKEPRAAEAWLSSRMRRGRGSVDARTAILGSNGLHA